MAVCAVRTGTGKSQTSRHVAGILRQLSQRLVVVHHPMPYGDLSAMAVQRFETYQDLTRYDVTINLLVCFVRFGFLTDRVGRRLHQRAISSRNSAFTKFEGLHNVFE